MARLTVKLDNDHLDRLVRGPGTGLAELIWNALDADAHTVDVTVSTSPLGAPEEVVVRDDGHGMDGFDIQEGFSALGGSWKKRAKVSRGEKRRLHGEQGKGRFGAFGIGDRVRWITVVGDWENSEFQISGSRHNLRDFDIVGPVTTSDPVGTRVVIDLLSEQAARWLDRPSTKDSLAATFAIYLESYPQAKISFRGDALDPSAMQENRTEYQLDLQDLRGWNSIEGQPTLVIIEWNRAIDRVLYLCNAEGMAAAELQPKIQAPGSDFTAYLKWAGFEGHDVLLAEQVEPMASIIDLARDKMREHFRRRTVERQRAVITDWIQEGVYPYSSATGRRSGIQIAERQVFDVVAYTAASTINAAGDRRAKKLSLRLLREAVESNPGDLHNVLRSVLELPAERLSELSQLLERTTLSAVINTSKRVADRLDFLMGLDALLFDAESRRTTLERRQLHRILAQETWIFGEEYALTGDDESLSKVLRKYLEFLGGDVDLADAGPVRRHDGRDVIPDLVLSRTCEIAQDRVENLVVELKRPSVTLTSKETTQIEEYADAVVNDERFQQPNVLWDFWLIGNDIDRITNSKRNQTGLPFGYIYRTDQYRIQVRTWAEVLNDAKHRLKFVERTLNYQVSHDSGVQYLRETHAKYLPAVLAEDAQVSPESSEDSAELDEQAS
ncbi:Uncharacterised protein [Nocardia otitidiscaviarum]|uniref:DNA mismatch repair protein n=1 Tax=Nocardia otitidiscaviarum TaxID=1823 RepID=A0A378Y8M2_9NOCA|nr:ATP-binding protein [Nocardia otitidiscaviarum]MBF6241907.1 ATP-binding protein [Nocardia otitidiscaviarum]SUA72851.1 Uncharacterised protein [Nocardia otitidiscaviarum]